MGYDHGWSTLAFVGAVMALVGPGTAAKIIQENWKIRWGVWDRWERGVAILGGIGFFVGVAFMVFGCGAREPEPTDPVWVEVVVCDSALGGTAGQYLRLKIWRQGEGICDEMIETSEDRQQAIREATERDIDDLDHELDAYLASSRTDCYNGPVFNELQRLVNERRRYRILCHEP
ncbi:hypothetical protein KKD80_01040 [Patescibacteria group bacterium]|nr:hypothetical protein [Patescibacteria group bacterium]